MGSLCRNYLCEMSRYLIIQTAFFGDVILATGLIEQLAAENRANSIDVLVQKSREVLLHNHPFINEILILDKSKKLRSSWRLIKTLQKARYDVVINIHRHGTSGVITWLSGARETIGFDVHPLSFLFDRKIEHRKEGMHEVDRNYELVRHLVTLPAKMPKLYPSAIDYEKVAHHNPYITISPASVWQTKRWPADKWVALIEMMPETLDIFLLGGPGDLNLCTQISNQANRKTIMKAGEYGFLESAALMSKARMNYTNDSAPVHLATAMNAPVSVLFCSTIPEFGYGPRSEENYVFVYPEKLACRPCGVHGRTSCPEGHFRCADISPQEVIAKSLMKSNDNDNE